MSWLLVLGTARSNRLNAQTLTKIQMQTLINMFAMRIFKEYTPEHVYHEAVSLKSIICMKYVKYEHSRYLHFTCIQWQNILMLSTRIKTTG